MLTSQKREHDRPGCRPCASLHERSGYGIPATVDVTRSQRNAQRGTTRDVMRCVPGFANDCRYGSRIVHSIFLSMNELMTCIQW
jgi:hypothetical protein